MAAHNDIGEWGEEVATDYLRRKGYTIVERDWKSGHRDLDIIAMDGQTLVVVEVKTRHDRLFGNPEDAIDYHKLKSLRMSANHWMKTHRWAAEVRLDVVCVVGTPGTAEPEIEHIEDFQW